MIPVAAAAILFAGCGGGAGVAGGGADETVVVVAPQDAPVLAVTSLAMQGTDAAEAAIVTDLLRRELMRLGRWRVIDRESQQALLAGHALQLAGVASEAEAASLGKLLNARLITVGTFGILMGQKVVTCRIVDVETGLATNAGTAEGKTVEELKRGLADMVRTFK